MPDEKKKINFKGCHGVLGEHFKSYLFVGFDYDEQEAYVVWKSDTDMESHALQNLMAQSVAEGPGGLRGKGDD